MSSCSCLLPQRFICKAYSQLCMFLDTLGTWRDIKVENSNSLHCCVFLANLFFNSLNDFHLQQNLIQTRTEDLSLLILWEGADWDVVPVPLA